jgi:hypothetical protein
MILIGSCALQHHVKLPADRKIADQDYVGTYEQAMEFRKRNKIDVCYPINSGKSIYMRDRSGIIVEVEIAWPDSMAERLVEFVMSQPDNIASCGGSVVPSLDVLYLLKLSHKYKKDSPFFKKTMDDIIFMRDVCGAKLRDEHMEFFQQREKETYQNQLPKLNRTKEEFFNPAEVKYEWQHDDLHLVLAHLDKPAYQYFSGGEVWSDMDVFETLPENTKLLAVLEESLVLAAERSQLAFPDKKIDPKWSFDMALSKVCTSITSGRFRSYAYDNYYKVQDLYEQIGKNYMERVYDGIKTGKVRKFGME